jgi:hypothetical protein
MLDYFFKPKSVAIIGTSSNTNKGGYHIMNLRPANWDGIIKLKIFLDKIQVEEIKYKLR